VVAFELQHTSTEEGGEATECTHIHSYHTKEPMTLQMLSSMLGVA